MSRTSMADDSRYHAWVGHWWMGGVACYNRGEAADSMFKFYHEVFQVKGEKHTLVVYYLEASGLPVASTLSPG